MTGCRKRHYEVVRGYGAGCATLLEIFMQVEMIESFCIVKSRRVADKNLRREICLMVVVMTSIQCRPSHAMTSPH